MLLTSAKDAGQFLSNAGREVGEQAKQACQCVSLATLPVDERSLFQGKPRKRKQQRWPTQ